MQWLINLPEEYRHRIILHSHFELAEKFELRGIHLNEKNRPVAGQLGNYKIVSASFHSLEDLKLNVLPYEYVFVSPIFDSISKEEYKANFNLDLLKENLREMKQQNPSLPKVIALGGVNAQNAKLVIEIGFSGCALLGAVWQSKNPVEMFSEIQSVVSENT